ncbi:hypothetical protein GGX14DRAFT_325194, partial [Mycena pura]
CPFYWSLHRSGTNRLTAEQADELGFPPVNFKARAHGYSWDSDIYAMYHDFHQGKGFDPESEDIARRMEY